MHAIHQITLNRLRNSKCCLTLVLVLAVAVMPVCAQQPAQPRSAPRKSGPPKAGAPQTPAAEVTLDNLLAADRYKVYGEVKNVGQVLRSGNIADLLDPIMKLADPPKEVKLLVKFANSHAESLSTARLVIAFWPAQPRVPQALLAIELSSSDEARKFEAELRGFLPKILPSPTPVTPIVTNESDKIVSNGKDAAAHKEAQPQADPKPSPPPFVIKQTGSIVLLSETALDLKTLRPPGSKLLADDQNFRQVRERFGSEPIFVFFNVALNEKGRSIAEEQPPADKQNSTQANRVVVAEPAPTVTADPQEMGPPETEPAEPDPSADGTPAFVPQQQTTAVLSAGPAQETASIEPFNNGLGDIMSALFGGQPKWPEAVGAVIAFDGDAYVARVLLVYGAEGKPLAVPFVPQLISGPALIPESPSVLPADTELFVTASIDTTQIYENIVRTLNEGQNQFARQGRVSGKAPQPEVPFAALEKRLGIKIKEELLPILGNEIAVSVPLSVVTGKSVAPPTPATDDAGANAKKSEPNPIVLISLKDKQAAHDLLPRIIDGFIGGGGNKAPDQLSKMLAQTEKREDTEIVSYAGTLSYAFIGNFLVLSPDTPAIRHVVDSYLNHQVLAADSHFRNFTRWQPRQLQGQVYISPALVESYRTSANDPTALIGDQVKDFLRRLSPESEPVTYALSNEGAGPLHELHVPRNLLLMMVASIAGESNQSPLRSNESMARIALSVIASSEAAYRTEKESGNYATLEQLITRGSLSKELLEQHGYRIDLTTSGAGFEATAVPLEYSKTGMLSYFVNESGVIRAADHGGARASVADHPIQ